MRRRGRLGMTCAVGRGWTDSPVSGEQMPTNKELIRSPRDGFEQLDTFGRQRYSVGEP